MRDPNYERDDYIEDFWEEEPKKFYDDMTEDEQWEQDKKDYLEELDELGVDWRNWDLDE